MDLQFKYNDWYAKMGILVRKIWNSHPISCVKKTGIRYLIAGMLTAKMISSFSKYGWNVMLRLCYFSIFDSNMVKFLNVVK